MKAWILEKFGGYENLHLTEQPERIPGEGEVSVRVTMACVNPIDRAVIGGRFPWLSLPHIPGAEFIGEITGTGSDVTNLQKGLKVAINPKLFCGKCHYCLRGRESSCLENKHIDTAPYIIGLQRQGGWSEFVNVPAMNVVQIPDGVLPEQAVTAPVDGATAWHLASRLRPEIGEIALVMGSTGGVGLFMIQLLKMRGCEVIAVAGTPEQESMVRALGAGHVIHRNTDDIPSKVRELSGGRGADIVVDPLGAGTWNTSVSSLAPMGKYGTCGTLTGIKTEMSILHMYSIQAEFIGSTSANRADLNAVLELMSKGKLRGIADSTFQFDDVQDSLKRLDEHGRRGKVLLRAGR